MQTSPLYQSDISLPMHVRADAGVTLVSGDVRDLLPYLPDNSITLIITSPPYNIGKEYETRVPLEDYLREQTSVIEHLCRVLRDDGSICWLQKTKIPVRGLKHQVPAN